MTRNHFSKAGGPYFINNGISAHKEHHVHDDSHIHEYMLEVGFLRKLFNLVKSKFKRGPL